MALLLSGLSIIQVPKTGTTFIRKALKNAGVAFSHNHTGHAGNQHDGIHNLTEEELKNRIIFSVGREPLSHLKSVWCYAAQNGRLRSWKELLAKKTEYPNAMPGGLWETCMVDNWNLYGELLVHTRNASFTSYRHFSRWGYVDRGGVWEKVGRTIDVLGDLRYVKEDLSEVLDRVGIDFNKAAIHNTCSQNRAGSLPKNRDLKFSRRVASNILEMNTQLMDMLDSIPR
jgi:hypothetical protein